mgnify:FL=1
MEIITRAGNLLLVGNGLVDGLVDEALERLDGDNLDVSVKLNPDKKTKNALAGNSVQHGQATSRVGQGQVDLRKLRLLRRRRR